MPAIRRLAVLAVTFALIVGGLAAAPSAAAATSKTWPPGTGSGSTTSVSLDPGIYAVEFDYDSNMENWFDDEYFETNMIVWLESESGREQDLIVNDIAESGSKRHIVELTKKERVWLDIDAASDAQWYASIDKLTLPTKSETSFTEKGTGSKSTSLHRLAKGTYTFTATYSGNKDEYGDSYMGVFLLGEDDEWILLVNDIDSSGTVTRKVVVYEPVVVWLEVDSAPSASWSVKAKMDEKKFSKAPKPTISGTVKAGKTLTAKAGTWSPKPSFAYQWYRDGVKISGATKSTYKPTSSDCGKPLTVKVTGKKSGYAKKTVTSKATKKVACSTFSKAPKPTISGTAKVGSKLTAKAGTWKPKPKLTYQWYRGTSKIKGATKSTYTLTGADAGKTITVKVTGKKANYKTTTTTSKATKKVASGTFTTAPVPTISGTAAVGNKLTATAGTWKPKASVAYQWLRDGAKISGATKSTYALVAADRGKAITVAVTGTTTGYKSITKTSKATAKVAYGTFTTAPNPTISGEAKVGELLTAETGAWAPAATFAYQWFSNGVEIPGATNPVYSLAEADLDQVIHVNVTGQKDGYTPVTRSSAATVPIIAAEGDDGE